MRWLAYYSKPRYKIWYGICLLMCISNNTVNMTKT